MYELNKEPKDKTNDSLKDIFNHFGWEKQKRKLQEEVDEFKDEIILFENGIGDINNVIGEAADVLVLFSQFLLSYDISEDELLNKAIEKVERTKKRIEEGYYD